MGFNQDSRTINASKNALSSFCNKMIMLCLTFISRKLFIKYIGIEYLGINGLFANVLTLLSLADLGVGTAMNVSLYKPLAEHDTRKLSALLNYFRQLYHLIAITVFLIGVALTPFLKYIINMDRDIPHLYWYYVIFVAKNAVSYLFAYKSSVIRADQKRYLVDKVDIYTSVCKVLLQFVAVITLHSYLVYILIDVAQIIVYNVALSVVADQIYPFLSKCEKLDKGEKRGIFSDISSVFLYKVSYSLLNGTDNILMSMIVGTVYVGIYSNYLTIASNLESFVALLFTALTASVGNLIATADSTQRYKTFNIMQMVSFWLCGNICVSLLFLTQDFVQMWFGKELLLDNLTVIAIVLNTFFSICMQPIWTFREGTGMYRQIRYIMFVTAMLNLVLSIVLGKWLGISGILFATSISKICTYFWYEPNILFRDFFQQSVKGYYLNYFMNVMLILFCGVVCYLPISRMREVTVLNWFLKEAICFVVVNSAFFMRYRKTSEMKDMLQKVLFLVRSKRA